mmetsp:Transcript_11959/g.29036  ORF Transcript_11959/g.29036 Transcript_11959/m.29036 type:complete len:642 (+) Transcript_11959:75-2000(+)
MKKWITSNYHYMVPECDTKELLQADFSPYMADVKRGIAALGKECATPVVVGPVTIAYLTQFESFSKGYHNEQRKNLLAKLLPLYQQLLKDVAATGVTEIQVHEAALVFEDADILPLFQTTYPAILPTQGPAINIVSFMEDVGQSHYEWLTSVKEFDVISMDFTRGDSLSLIKANGFPKDKTLGCGVVDARSVWSIDPTKVKPILDAVLPIAGGNLRIQPSASLQFTPWDLSCEKEILAHPAGAVLAFATQKLKEVSVVAKACSNPDVLDSYSTAWTKYRAVASAPNSAVGQRIKSLASKDFERSEKFEARRPKQLKGVPLLPTTTIGSFPQTKEVRSLRTQKKKGLLSQKEYEAAIDQQIALAIGIQTGLGLDIRIFLFNKFSGMLFTTNGWVQSFGSRCVRPPIFWADIHRPTAMTVREFKVAQDLTDKPVKGMLTGPVTILNWSFPRQDISRKEQAYQIGLAIQDEIADLEAAGCQVIQVDEPALREAMPLREQKKQEYLDWAVDSFRLATAKAKSETQIHTHMCYCEFQDCMEAIDKLDTDCNSIENARNDNRTLMAFKDIGYTKDLGPGTYDIHSPVVPPIDFIVGKLNSFLECMEPESLVVNPDCGLKTRTWPETIGALQNMVEATKKVRKERHIG